MPEERLIALLNGATFPEPRPANLKVIAHQILDNHGGRVPDSLAELTAFRGVGPKIAALTLAVGFGRPAIAVDVHVHRITNRWGYVATTSPESTMLALEKMLPQRYWIEINERLVPFGKFICTAARPKCSTCLLLSMCRQVGVCQSPISGPAPISGIRRTGRWRCRRRKAGSRHPPSARPAACR